MSLIPQTIYGGGFSWWTNVASINDNPAAPDEPAKPDQPLERDKYGAAGFAWADWCADAPPPTLDTWWRMRQHPTCVFAYALSVLPICAGSRQATIRVNESQQPARTKPTVPTGAGTQVVETQEEKRRKLIEDVWETLWPSLYAGLEYLNFGHWTMEVQWDRKLGVVAPVRFKSFAPGTIEILKDKFNDFAGYKLGQEERDSRYGLHFVCNGHLHDPIFGWPRARNARKAWWRSEKSHVNGDGLEQKASGIQMFLQYLTGEGFTDKKNNPVVPADMAKALANAARQGQVFYGPLNAFDKNTLAEHPELAKMKAIEVQQLDHGDTGPPMLAAISRLDRLDKEIVRAYNRPEREGMEGKFGTKAESGVQGAIGTLDSEGIHTDWLGQHDNQTLDRFAVTNFGPEEKGKYYFKPAPLADPQQLFLQAVVEIILGNQQAAKSLLERIDRDALFRRTEVPLLPEGAPPQIEVTEPKPVDPNNPNAPPGTNGKPVNGNGAANRMKLSADAMARGVEWLGGMLGNGEDDDDDGHSSWVPGRLTALSAGNCGTGAGGFQPGNTCAKGGGRENVSYRRPLEFGKQRPLSEVPDWARESRAYDPKYQPYAADWVRTAARNAKAGRYKFFNDYFDDDHVSIGPSNNDVKLFLQESLGRQLDSYRGGWQVTIEESDWLGFDLNEQSVTLPTLIKRAGQRAGTESGG